MIFSSHLFSSFLYSVGADVIFKELRFAQSKDDFLRKSTMTNDGYAYDNDDIDYEENDGGQLLEGNYDEKTSAASFQQALMQWRQGGGGTGRNQKTTKKPLKNKKKFSTHEAAVDTVEDSNGKFNQINIPNIEFHSTNLTYGEKLLLKKYRRANKNHEEFFNQRIPSTNLTSREPTSRIENISVNRSLPQNVSLKVVANIDVEVCFYQS